MVVYLEHFTQPLKGRQYFKFPYMDFYGQNEGFQVVSGCVCVVGRRIFCSITKTHHDTEEKIWSDFCKELMTLFWARLFWDSYFLTWKIREL